MNRFAYLCRYYEKEASNDLKKKRYNDKYLLIKPIKRNEKLFQNDLRSSLIGFSTSANAIDRHSLAQYAASLKGLKKEQLKAALYDIMKQKTVLVYGGKPKGTWYGFWYSDRDTATNECYNRYSDKKFYFGNKNDGKL